MNNTWTTEHESESSGSSPTSITWTELVELEPRLENLLEVTRALYPRGITAARWEWIKLELAILIGWDSISTDQRLHTSQAWECCVNALLNPEKASTLDRVAV